MIRTTTATFFTAKSGGLSQSPTFFSPPSCSSGPCQLVTQMTLPPVRVVTIDPPKNDRYLWYSEQKSPKNIQKCSKSAPKVLQFFFRAIHVFYPSKPTAVRFDAVLLRSAFWALLGWAVHLQSRPLWWSWCSRCSISWNAMNVEFQNINLYRLYRCLVIMTISIH